MSNVDKEREEEIDRELDAAIDGDRIQLSVDLVQARMLLCIHRAGVTVLQLVLDKRCGKNAVIDGEAAIFSVIHEAYNERSLKLKAALMQFDDSVEERMGNLAMGTVYSQLVELLGKDVMDLMFGEEKEEEDDGTDTDER